MIKLNNKNITYVALADSNNSLKAPKEIWYADSNNSVKLVYRRKDALIEGEDYEKYHWLVGDADAYINTLKYYRPYDDSVQMTFRDNLYPNRESKYNKYNAEEQIWGACKGNSNYIVRSYVSGTGNNSINKFSNNILDSDRTEGDVHWDAYAVRSYINASSEHSLYMSSVDANTDKYYFIYNGDTKNNLSTRYTLPELIQQNVLVFYSANITNGYFNGSFFNFIHYRNNVEITHLIPCKLLKPVPKWLDANGIRRQVGECGMIDLVSGKFYGNVNNVGTFTVENYYERKEWLQGRNGAYINTNHKLKAFEDSFEVRARYDGTIRNPNGQEQNIFGYTHLTNGEITEICRAYINSSGRISCNYYTPDGNWASLPDSQGVTDITLLSSVESTTHTVVLNGTTYTLSTNGMQSKEYGSFIALFSNNGDDDGGTRVRSKYFHGDIAYFKITDNSSNTKMNLIPCTLTMDLPASMDANNIARTKGTSGMWDLVSDRFYGNVASSGTFKAVNLAEGVDYEVHQWLKVSVSAKAEMTGLPVYSPNLYFKHKHISGINYHYFRTTGEGVDYDYFYESDTYRCSIWNLSNKTVVYHTSDITEDEIVINCNSSNMYVNGYDIPIYGSTIKQVSIISRNQNGFEGLISSITVDGIERYIPVKLLRSIPSKYDANGIARQAGECGMYDTVNDKFYGNVASSGRFTVEDDN